MSVRYYKETGREYSFSDGTVFKTRNAIWTLKPESRGFEVKKTRLDTRESYEMWLDAESFEYEKKHKFLLEITEAEAFAELL